MKKTIISRTVCWIIVIFLLLACVIVLGWLLRPKECDNAVATISAYDFIPEDSLDVILYGSSHMWLGINSRYLYNEYGVAAFNHACMWQHINTTDLFVRSSLGNQSPKVIVVDTGRVNEALKDTGMDGEIYYTRSLPWSRDKVNYLRGCFGNDASRYIEYLLPFAAFHTNWDTVSADAFTSQGMKPDVFLASLGYLGNGGAESVNMLDPKEFWQEPLSDEAISYLDDILAVAKENGAEVLLITVPSYSGEYMYGDALSEYARQRGCNYIDFFKLANDIGLDGENDFYDSEHLNIDGSIKITDYLAGYLKDNYDIPDRRNEENDPFQRCLEEIDNRMRSKQNND